MYPISEFNKAKIVIHLDQYGVHHCFHIDPGNGDTIPIYIDAHVRDKMARAVNAIQSEFVDIEVAEVAFGSGFKRFLTSIKESNARQ